MVSILILTRNEEQDLPGCLASVAWCDDVHVLDSYSTDSTVELARAAGAEVHQRVFDNWAAHQNWALAHVPFRHPWVFYLDADERMSEGLRADVKRVVEANGDCVAFRVARRDYLYGTWLRHVQASRLYLRLFRPERMRYERLVNPVAIPDGPTGEVNGYLDHYPFSKGVAHWVARHNQYSTLEAKQIVANRQQRAIGAAISPSLRSALFESDFHVRRFHQKEVFYRLPVRAAIKFLLLLVIKRGFLDGAAGLTYATLQSCYEYMIVLKTKELEQGRRVTAAGSHDVDDQNGAT